MNIDRSDPEIDAAFARMQRVLPRVAPPADLVDQITSLLERPTEPYQDVLPAARSPRIRRRPTFTIAVGATLVAVVAALVIAVTVPGGPSPDASAALVAHGTSGAHGSVDLYGPATTAGRVVVHLRGLAVAPTGDHYTIWVLRQGVREMTPVASIAAGEDVRIDVPLPGPGRYTALDISLQPNDASPVHSGTSVAGASFS